MIAASDIFEIPAGVFNASYLAEVVSVDDPLGLARVQLRLLSFDGVGEQDGPLWARVAAPFAGADRGAFMLPDVGDEVVVNFLNGDPRLPVVVGGLWNGSAKPPETLGGAGDRIDRWTIVGKAGTRIAIVEEKSGQSQILFETPGGVTGELTDAGGGKIELKAAGTTITVDTGGVSIQTSAKIKAQASQVEISAGMVKVDAAMSQFSGVVKCDVLQATTVVATTYTPGAGNIW
ncbi:MAG: phage baseplate assembly protein V [Verrucomicrobia subdivision 3 bacterium]|nr:phage baseplate assembly protein V [Limisphaerales bacterium]